MPSWSTQHYFTTCSIHANIKKKKKKVKKKLLQELWNKTKQKNNHLIVLLIQAHYAAGVRLRWHNMKWSKSEIPPKPLFHIPIWLYLLALFPTERKRESDRERERERQRERERDIETKSDRDRERERQRETDTERQTERQRQKREREISDHRLKNPRQSRPITYMCIADLWANHCAVKQLPKQN